MPGNVANAVATETMPWSLCRAFVHAREYLIAQNEYRNGESQRDLLVDTSRKHWILAKRLAPAQLEELRDFYEARGGPLEAFYFYDPWETDPKFDSTPSGGAGRYLVRFAGPWEQSAGAGRADANLLLIELA